MRKSQKSEEKKNERHESTVIPFLQQGVFVTAAGLSLLWERDSIVKSKTL